MKTAIRQRAIELGFDDCRITTANAPDHAERFEKWIADNHHGEMGWLAHNAHKRVDPQQVLANARSIITLATSYAGKGDIPVARTLRRTGNSRSVISERVGPSETGGSTDSLSTGEIARYARYADYHDVLKDPLVELTGFVDSLKDDGSRSLWYVDTGPFLERDLAQRAGLGFVGKHTNLISRKLGNWFFISEIITRLELEPDVSETNHCGKCTRCITACPTNAITAPFELDARKCISYLTIELKGSIPEELRPAIGNRIYGCDDCLAACPWNRFAREGRLMKSSARDELDQPELLEILKLDQPGFKQRFAGTPMLRTKRRGILRNVCVALGNVGDESALPALEQATGDQEELIREHAAWAMAQIEQRKRNGVAPVCADSNAQV
jgi:epoxyqueuosine reductase